MLRLAIESSADIWIELTEAPAESNRIRRIRTSTLGQAQKITASAPEPVFVDVRAYLAGLIWDIWAARVADGITLRSDVPAVLLSQVLETVLPELEAHGVRFRVGGQSRLAAA
jgi:hypothetical protein